MIVGCRPLARAREEHDSLVHGGNRGGDGVPVVRRPGQPGTTDDGATALPSVGGRRADRRCRHRSRRPHRHRPDRERLRGLARRETSEGHLRAVRPGIGTRSGFHSSTFDTARNAGPGTSGSAGAARRHPADARDRRRRSRTVGGEPGVREARAAHVRRSRLAADRSGRHPANRRLELGAAVHDRSTDPPCGHRRSALECALTQRRRGVRPAQHLCDARSTIGTAWATSPTSRR